LSKGRVRSISPLKTLVDVEFELERVRDVIRLGEVIHLSVPMEPGLLSERLNSLPHLAVEELVQLRNWFMFVVREKKKRASSSVRSYFNKMGNYSRHIEEINKYIDDNSQIKDNATEELYRIRLQVRKVKKRIQDTLNRILIEQQHLYSDTAITIRNGKYVLPVKRNFKKEFHGIVHSYSNSGETVFMEPFEIADDSAQLVELDEQEKAEIEKILQYVTAIVAADADQIEADIEVIIDLDVLSAKAQYADVLHATMPIFDVQLNIVNGYHPILRELAEDVVPLNLRMDVGKKILLISGPNAGGKTVVLKTIGLLVLMAKCGMYIPIEEGSTLPFFEEVYADIGDEQSLESRLSTFAAHIKQIKNALDSDAYALVLLDELMSQTSVEEGSALATAILGEFAGKRSLVLATTHNEDLKLFVSRHEQMVNAGMEFTDKPTYRLIMGIPQPSNAIKLARELGINGSVIENALQFLDKDKMSLNTLFEDLSAELKVVQDERSKLSRLIDQYETQLRDINDERKKKLDEVKTKYKQELIQAKRSIEKMVKDLKQHGPKQEAVRNMRAFFEEKLKAEEPHEPYIPKIGEMVRIRELRKVGQVIEEHAGKFKVSLDNIYYWVEPKELEQIEA
jgi:DNA mismatch repair protein MutS2